MAQDAAATGFTLSLHTAPDSMQAAFLRRAVSALERIAQAAPPGLLAEALARPTDAGSLAQLLGRGDLMGPAVAALDPLVPALARNLGHRQALLERAGGALSAAEAGAALGISRQAVDKRRRAGSLLAIREGGDWRYPSCQFGDSGTVAGLAEVVRGMAAAGPWATLDFLLAPDAALGGATPLAALQAGDAEGVTRLLRANGADGFG